MCGESIPNSATDGRLAVVISSIVATPIHFISSVFVSLQLFRSVGGISTSGQWTTYGGIDFAWTNVTWLPGGLLFAIGDGGPARPAPFGLLALLFLLAGSFLAAYLFASLIVRLFRRSDLGRFHWRLWVSLLAWCGWIPVPAKMTLTYWHTVA